MQLSALSQAEEYHDIRLKAGEKALYKEINKANGIKFPIKVDLALHAHKRSLLIQAELGGVEFPAEEQYAKHRRQHNQDTTLVFSHVNRLIRCVVDCQIHLQDAVGARHALELARSFSARVWDNSPLQMKQLPQIGLAAIRKLAMGGVNSIEALETTEPHRIETLMSKNPPFGQKLLGGLKDFPKLRVSIKLMGKEIKPRQSVKINIKVECGFLNDRAPTVFHRRQIYVCLLVERSDGLLVDFRRMSAKKLANGQDMLMSAPLTHHDQYITSHVMCDEIAGTVRCAELKHNILASVFPPQITENQRSRPLGESDNPNHGRPLGGQRSVMQQPSRHDEFSDGDFDDEDFIALADANGVGSTKPAKSMTIPSIRNALPVESVQANRTEASWNPTQLHNGKWACNHKCKDKSTCKHLCCRDGVDKAPKPPKASTSVVEANSDSHVSVKPKKNRTGGPTQSKLVVEKQSSASQSQDIHTFSPNKGRDNRDDAKVGPRAYERLRQLHERVNKASPAKVLPQTKPAFHCSHEVRPRPSFLSEADDALEVPDISSDYTDAWMDDLPPTSVLLRKPIETEIEPIPASPSDSGKAFEDQISDVEAAMIGLQDSASLSREVAENTQSVLTEGDIDWDVDAADGECGAVVDDSPPFLRSTENPRAGGLFLSTDSPEGREQSINKRKAIVDSEVAEDSPSSPPLAKKSKTTTDSHITAPVIPAIESLEASPSSGQTLEISTYTENQHLLPLPEWTKDIDPEFLAYFVREYGHLVEWWPEETPTI